MATRSRAIRLGGLGLSALMALAIAAPAVAQAEEMDFSDVRVAIVPGGPHPYFLPMEPGLADSVAENGLGQSEFRAPPAWDLNDQNQLLNSMAAQGFNAFGIFPGDANATNAIMSELSAAGFPVMAIAGCVTEPTDAAFCFGTDVANSAYLGTKALIEAMGGEGAIMHGTGFLVDPNTTLRIDAVERAVAETDGQGHDRGAPRRHRRPGVRGREDQLVPGGSRRRDRRHRDHGLRALHGIGDRAAQPR